MLKGYCSHDSSEDEVPHTLTAFPRVCHCGWPACRHQTQSRRATARKQVNIPEHSRHTSPRTVPQAVFNFMKHKSASLCPIRHCSVWREDHSGAIVQFGVPLSMQLGKEISPLTEAQWSQTKQTKAYPRINVKTNPNSGETLWKFLKDIMLNKGELELLAGKVNLTQFISPPTSQALDVFILLFIVFASCSTKE